MSSLGVFDQGEQKWKKVTFLLKMDGNSQSFKDKVKSSHGNSQSHLWLASKREYWTRSYYFHYGNSHALLDFIMGIPMHFLDFTMGIPMHFWRRWVWEFPLSSLGGVWIISGIAQYSQTCQKFENFATNTARLVVF